jgi:hypothetical protein
MAMMLRESDSPRTFASKIAEYVQKPAWPTPKFLKDQVKVSPMPNGGRRLDFAIRQGTPFPIIYNITARAENDQHFEELVDFDHVGPFSTDDWVLEITGWTPEIVVLKVGIEPFEFQTDEVRVKV